MAVSKMRDLQIANICYANVSGEFAAFCDPAKRGVNFTWEWFIERAGSDCVIWLNANFSRYNQECIDLAKKYSKEIAETLVRRHCI